MSASPSNRRPLSPFTTVWRWHLTMAMSILHRITGVGLYLGAFLLVMWLAAAAGGPDLYRTLEGLLLSPLGRLVLFGFTLSATYHLFNGVRHLFWDTGAGFNPKTATATGWLVILLSLIATFAIWAAAYWL